jgi:Rrf2 family protein
VNRLNRKVEYALMALKVMSTKTAGELTSAKEVVDQVGCPFDATARVLQQLAQKEILKSEQGARGGYLLNRDLNRISVFDLMEIVSGPMEVAKCIHSEDGCDLMQTCNITSPIASFNRKVRDFYRSVSVSELLEVKA